MGTGIALSHVRQHDEGDRELRTDHAAFVGIVPEARWPEGADWGDAVRFTVDGLDAFEANPATTLLDSATRTAVRAFFGNGGRRCTLYGVFLRSERDLMDPRRLRRTFGGLLKQLRDDEDSCLLNVPPLAWLPARQSAGRVEVTATAAVVELLRHCQEVGHRFLVLDAPRTLDEDGVVQWVARLRAVRDIDLGYGAVYHPWLCRGDLEMPPSGAVLGVFARVDRENAPYGVRAVAANQELVGFTHTSSDLRFTEARELVEAGVNPVIVQPARGVVVWGARTLSTDPRWQQITARRIVSFVTERVRRDAEWVVFEHQRPELWETVARMVRSRLDAFWGAGLLTGEQAGSEYVVQCDEELNPPAVRDAGQVHFKVLLRPVSTTEFIEVELALGA